MQINRTYIRFLWVLLLTLLATGFLQTTHAQNQVSILEANRIEGGTYEGERVQKILGDVHLQAEGIEMYCDSAYQFVNKDEIRSFGNIEINTEEEKIWSDTLIYYTDVDFSQLRGRVIIEAEETTLFGNSVDYRFSTRVAHFIDEIRLEDPQGVLMADSGYYYREADSAEFRGHVQLVDSLQYLEGDSLYSNRSAEYYELHGDIFGDDRENNTMIKGDYLEADSTGRRLLEGNAWLKNFEADTVGVDTAGVDTAGADTTHIQAEIILSEENRTAEDTSTVVHGYENVRIWSPSFAAVADTSMYDDRNQTFELWSNSVAWHNEVQLTGPYIKALLNEGEIDSLTSFPRPFSVQEDTTIDRLNQITGDTLQAGFQEGTLSEIFVFGEAHLLRFTKNDDGDPDGAIDLTAPTIRIFFEEGELREMKAVGAVDGSYLPESSETAERELEGFSWDPDRRPQQPRDPMRARFEPVPDTLFFELPRRYQEHVE